MIYFTYTYILIGSISLDQFNICIDFGAELVRHIDRFRSTLLIIFIEENINNIGSIKKKESNFKKYPKYLTNHFIPKAPNNTTSSQASQPQSSTRISSQEKPYFYEERQASLSERLIPAIRQASLSESQKEPKYNIYPLLQQDLNRTKQPSRSQNLTSIIERQIIHPRRNRNFATPRIHFNISSSTSSTPLNLLVIQSKVPPSLK